MTDHMKPSDELFRLASLIGCEPEKEAKHRQDLLDYVEAHYQPQAEGTLMTDDFNFMKGARSVGPNDKGFPTDPTERAAFIAKVNESAKLIPPNSGELESDNDGELREQFLQLGPCIGPYDEVHRCSSMHCDHCGLCDISEDVIQLIKQNSSPKEAVSPPEQHTSKADDPSIPDDAGELGEKVVSELLQYKAELNQGLNQLASDKSATELSAERLLHLIHQQRQEWEARALRQEIEGRILEVKRNMPNEDAISKYTRFAMQNRIEELETELSSLAADDGKEDV